MSISSLRALHLSALSLEVWPKTVSVIITQGSRLCRRAGCVQAWEQRGLAAADAVPPSARKGSNSKTNVFITSNRSAPQGRASCLRVECQLAVGTVAGGQRKFHISPRFLPLCSGPAGPHHIVGSSASLPALETQAPGKSKTLKSLACQPMRHPPTPSTHTAGLTLTLSEPTSLGH